MAEDKSNQSELALQFGVDLQRIAQLGMINPGSVEASQAYERLGLSSEDRLYFQLTRDLTLDTAAFRPGDRLAVEGQDVVNAYIVREGTLAVTVGGRELRTGPGSVIGLAEGIAHHKHRMTVTAITVVSASVIPIYRAMRALSHMHKGLKGITRNTVMRILQTDEIPETFR